MLDSARHHCSELAGNGLDFGGLQGSEESGNGGVRRVSDLRGVCRRVPSLRVQPCYTKARHYCDVGSRWLAGALDVSLLVCCQRIHVLTLCTAKLSKSGLLASLRHLFAFLRDDQIMSAKGIYPH